MRGLREAGGPRGPTLPCCLILLLLRASTARPVDHCRKIDCTLERREYCPSGSHVCGPCLQGFEESRDGKCQEAPQSPKGKGAFPNVDAEIDYLATILSNQNPKTLQLADGGNITNPKPPPPPPNLPPSERKGNASGGAAPPQRGRKQPLSDALILGVVVACAVTGLLALMVAGLCWCRMRREMKLAEKADYPAFRSSPPPAYEKTSPGDNKLAQNAQMYHYQHQKQQMLSMEKNKDEPKHTDSAVTSDEENEDGDFTVYECPGLAPTGEMEVKNPLFDDSTLHHPGPKKP
ncbi:neural proliferation differentiation and control protein 1 [Spea bombifrons]|uniref:neural proliferation differentiation and control protein 1 n=1 Tax=Spea bombifrons TaxID=233779 RepID=UPI00234B25FF|nr:neural proliferation differentiation and control protein 1 [Spea bombifrons]